MGSFVDIVDYVTQRNQPADGSQSSTPINSSFIFSSSSASAKPSKALLASSSKTPSISSRQATLDGQQINNNDRSNSLRGSKKLIDQDLVFELRRIERHKRQLEQEQAALKQQALLVSANHSNSQSNDNNNLNHITTTLNANTNDESVFDIDTTAYDSVIVGVASSSSAADDSSSGRGKQTKLHPNNNNNKENEQTNMDKKRYNLTKLNQSWFTFDGKFVASRQNYSEFAINLRVF